MLPDLWRRAADFEKRQSRPRHWTIKITRAPSLNLSFLARKRSRTRVGKSNPIQHKAFQNIDRAVIFPDQNIARPRTPLAERLKGGTRLET